MQQHEAVGRVKTIVAPGLASGQYTRMAGLNLSPLTPRPTPPPIVEGHDNAYVNDHADFVPVLLAQLQDDLTRSRLREALWISIVVHLVALISLYTAPRWMPRPHPVLMSEADLMRQKELTYLELPQDAQKAPKVSSSDIISDKNRTAMSRRPTIDNRALQQLRDSRIAPPAPPQQQQQVPQQAMQQGQQAPPQQQQPQQPQQNTNPNALAMQQQEPLKQNPFAVQGTAGSAIQQAVRNANRGLDGGSGVPGFGQGVSGSKVYGNAEVLSDTMGVDFEPYLKRVVNDVRMNWYSLIPDSALPPFLKKGKVMIEFVIEPNGNVAGMHIVDGNSSGDVSLDRAAWGGITKSNPFQPLPKEFKGPYLRLRFRFFYNPGRGELQ
jgi:TonB family protein